jgi:hypothetical protein
VIVFVLLCGEERDCQSLLAPTNIMIINRLNRVDIAIIPDWLSREVSASSTVSLEDDNMLMFTVQGEAPKVISWRFWPGG